MGLQSKTTLRSTTVHLSLIAQVEPHFKNSGLHPSISVIMFTLVHSSSKNDIVLKFCDDCLAGRSNEEEFRENTSISIRIDSFQVTIKTLFHTFWYF